MASSLSSYITRTQNQEKVEQNMPDGSFYLVKGQRRAWRQGLPCLHSHVTLCKYLSFYKPDFLFFRRINAYGTINNKACIFFFLPIRCLKICSQNGRLLYEHPVLYHVKREMDQRRHGPDQTLRIKLMALVPSGVGLFLTTFYVVPGGQHGSLEQHQA